MWGHSIKKKRKQKWKNELGIEGTEWQKKAAGKEIETAESQRKRTEIVATILFSFLQIGFLPEVRCPQKVFSCEICFGTYDDDMIGYSAHYPDCSKWVHTARGMQCY